MQTSRMLQFFSFFITLLLAQFNYASCESDQSPTDQSVVVAMDISTSVSPQEMAMQLMGYESAFLSEEAEGVFLGCGCTEVTILVWSGGQNKAYETTHIKSKQDLEKIASFFAELQQVDIELNKYFDTGMVTMVDLALEKALEILSDPNNTSLMKSILISGDDSQKQDFKKENFDKLKAQFFDQGIRVFGAPIYVYEDSSKGMFGTNLFFSKQPELMERMSSETKTEKFYREHVVTHPNYLRRADSFLDLGPALIQSLGKMSCLIM